MLKIVIVDDDKQMQDMIRDKIKETADAFLNIQLLVFLIRRSISGVCEDTGIRRGRGYLFCGHRTWERDDRT